MYLEASQPSGPSEAQPKVVYIYENSCNNKPPLEYRIRARANALREIASLLKFRKLRLFNEEGAQYFEDDLKFVKNKTSLYASRGEEFDSHNCFGQYEIMQKLGEGGFGKVFLARHRHTGEKCAIKIIKITSVADIDSIFVEAEILKSLKHDNIVKVTNCLTLKNMEVAIIMEYLEGGELLKYVQKQGRLDEDTCRVFVKQIVRGISYCHDNNLIHRDLKLENILLVNLEDKKIKIIDFGIAGVMNRLTEEDLDVGSLNYMAPECFMAPVDPNNSVKFDGKMDVWAIGVILYSMLCNQFPFKGANNQEIKDSIRKGYYKIPADVKRSLSPECLNVIFRCLESSPKNRIKISELSMHEWLNTKGKQEQGRKGKLADSQSQREDNIVADQVDENYQRQRLQNPRTGKQVSSFKPIPPIKQESKPQKQLGVPKKQRIASKSGSKPSGTHRNSSSTLRKLGKQNKAVKSRVKL